MHLCGLLKTGFYNVASEEMISTLRPFKNTLVDEHGIQAENNVKEKEITNEKKPKTVESDEEISSVSFLSLFRYSSYIDKFLIGIGIALAVLSAACVPLLVANISFTMEVLVAFDISLKNETSGNYTSKIARSITTEEFLEDVASLCTWSVILSLFNVVGNYVSVAFFSLAAANQVFRIRCRFMQAVVRQDIAWFDTNKTGDFVAKFTRELNLIQEGIGEKVVILLDHCARTAVCFGLSLYYGWKLTLVILCVIPVLHIITTITTKIQLKISLQEASAYGVAGGVAKEVLSSIRTVVAFGGQRKEIKRYKTCLVSACQKGIKRSLFTSIGTASSRSIVFNAYVLVLWYGFKLVLESSDKPEPEYTWKNFILISRIALHGIQHLCYIAPYFEAFTVARSAAAKVFNTIQRIPPIDSSSDVGLRPPSLKGRIQLTNVHFKYPARPTMPVLRGFNLDVSSGETVALVGTSGCGKSTIIKLLLRFYDVDGGSIQVDGIDLQNLHLGWLREHVGLVEQEPVLFSTTIEENIRMGRQDATREDIERAARIANAHFFIEKLPNKYETLVGHRGIQLSGGQKQRVAIARALVKNPRILLLDEPTSALDSESETVVQAALDQARRGRTTLLVAHRLCTVRTADKIIVLDEGIVKETGTHDELMKARRLYYELVKTQINDPEVNGNEEMLSLQPDDSSAIGAGYEKMNEKTQHLHETNGHAITQISTSKENLQDGKEHKSIKKLLKVYAKEWPYALVGFIASVLIGIHEPAFGIIIGEMFGGLSESMEVIKSKASFLCLIILILATTSFIFSFLQMFMFSIAGEKFLCRLRKMVFANIVIQDISFFDESRNSVGSLCSRLDSDASTLQGATGFQLSIPIQVISTLGAAIFLAFYYSWRLTLVIVAFVPFMLLSSALEGRITGRFVHREKESMENASKVASDAIENIRTVASLHQEVTLYKLYRSALSDANEKSLIKSHVRGAVYAFAMMLHYLAFITTMGYGCFLVSRKELLHSDLLKFLQGVLISIFMLADVVVFMPDFEKARAAALRLIGLIDTKPTIDAFSKKGLVKNSINGSVHFSNIHFAYPSRPKWEVLRGLEAVIQPGKTVALVGSSGCGKSTCAQLLMRFYDHNKGSLEVDGENVRNLNVASHRSHLSLVSQEPVLFGRSIAENIAYGDNTRDKIDMSQIIEVARQANIHTFISSLPQGYDTPVGDRGTHLSGGQKQRISIARALIRNPRILLLDEATSALDTESEKVVQEALNLARFGRTCLVIAHRLATVQNADVILVLHNGEIAEKGTHQELIQKQGIYYRLLNMQN